MDVWKIRFLGAPHAQCPDRQAHLRSKETWAVLASLCLPLILRKESIAPLSRYILADRFWGESEAIDPRMHLRQCLTSLRDAFGNNCLVADRQDVQITPGWFVSDLEQIFTAYQKALASSSIEERLHWLVQAEQEIRGEFLEGWIPDTDEAQIWLIMARTDVRSRILAVLLLLAQTLEAVGNPTAAFDIVRRALLFQPDHRQAREMAWTLAVSTGQEDVMHALEQVASFRDAVEEFPTQGLNTVTLKDARKLQSLFEAELKTLPPDRRKVLLRLSVFPSPFSIELAEAICSASLSVMQELKKTPFLKQTADTFFLTPLVQSCAWKHLATATRRQLQKRLAQFCIQSLNDSPLPVNVLPAPLSPADRGRPFLLLALEWVLEQNPSLPHVRFINMLRYCGLNDLALKGVSYLQRVEEDAALTVEMRWQAGITAAYILMQADDNAGAITPLLMGQSLAEATSDRLWLATIHATLMRAYSNIGEWELARQKGRAAAEYSRMVEDRDGEAYCIRFLAEIDLYAGNPENALLLCENAQELGRDLPADSERIPDALYWKARILYCLKRWEEALDAIESALFRWQEAGDTKVGLCLCVLGQIHRELGRCAEARMHLEHAIYLHYRSAREGHRIAAVEALADVFCTMHKQTEARALYDECLVYYRNRGYASGIERLQQKLQP